jgi:hypothetical protein
MHNKFTRVYNKGEVEFVVIKYFLKLPRFNYQNNLSLPQGEKESYPGKEER